MSAETDLLPLPAEFGHPSLQALGIVAENYARANLAELQREVEGLRAEVAAWSKSYDRAVDLGQQHRDRAERLAEALEELARGEEGDSIIRKIARAALDQETTNG